MNDVGKLYKIAIGSFASMQKKKQRMNTGNKSMQLLLQFMFTVHDTSTRNPELISLFCIVTNRVENAFMKYDCYTILL